MARTREGARRLPHEHDHDRRRSPAPPGRAGRRAQPDPRDGRRRHRREPRPRAGCERGSGRRRREPPGDAVRDRVRAGGSCTTRYGSTTASASVWPTEPSCRANFVHHQGQLGFGAWGNGSVVSGNEISFNGTAGYSPGWEAGGSKSWQTDRHSGHAQLRPRQPRPGTVDRRRQHPHGVLGQQDHRELGSRHPARDQLRRHHPGQRDLRQRPADTRAGPGKAGIQIQSSGGTGLIEVAGNTVGDNANGIALIDSGEPGARGAGAVRSAPRPQRLGPRQPRSR